MATLELDDMQGFLRHGYPYFDAAAYCVFDIQDAAGTKDWLRVLLEPPGSEPYIDRASLRAPRVATDDCGVAIAFTARGLERLGLGEDALRTFVSEFQEGMAAEHRARLLGDVNRNRPATWDWGGRESVDGLLIVFAPRPEDPETGVLRDPPPIDLRLQEIQRIPGCPQFVRTLRGRLNLEEGTGVSREPFGFADGISQPYVEGLTLKDTPSGVRTLKAGEFVLGYRNEIDHFPASPSVAAEHDPDEMLPRLAPAGRADLGRNGTFLVMRELEQHVQAFNAFISGDEYLAARMVGRWRNGAPLVRYAQDQDGMTQRELEAANDFGYHAEDRYGFRCPIGSHIRRANPRDSFAGSLGITRKQAQDIVNQHRILRRGRAYADRQRGTQGLVFICLNANIERQFEFVQSSWLMHSEFGGLHGETDPLLGNGPNRSMTIQHPLLGERVEGLPQFVTVRGGGYFFLPGIRALRYLSQLSN